MPKKVDMVLTGFYHEYGYNIFEMVDGELGEEPLYEAGNCPGDSTAVISVERGLDLETIRRYCEQTGREMAEERGVRWVGCDREDDSYEGIE